MTLLAPCPYPSGLVPPAVPSGYDLVLFDDYLGTDVNPSIWTKYDGLFQNGTSWLPSHVVTAGSICSLCMYQDMSGSPSNRYWTGGGIGISLGLPFPGGQAINPGSIVRLAMRQDRYALVTANALLIGNTSGGSGNWPPEIDLMEATGASDGSLDDFYATIHYNAANNDSQVAFSSASLGSASVNNWHIWETRWPASISNPITFWRDNVHWGSLAYPADSVSGNPNSLVQTQGYGAQIIVGDPDESVWPPNDSTVTALKPIRFQMDWFQLLQAA